MALKCVGSNELVEREVKIIKMLKEHKCLVPEILSTGDTMIFMRLYHPAVKSGLGAPEDAAPFEEKHKLELLHVLASFHKAGVVHGDVRLSNVVFAKRDGKDELGNNVYAPLFCDFGAAATRRTAQQYIGTITTASQRVLLCLVQSRLAKMQVLPEDDLESFHKMVLLTIFPHTLLPERQKGEELSHYLMVLYKFWENFSPFRPFPKKSEGKVYMDMINYMVEHYSEVSAPLPAVSLIEESSYDEHGIVLASLYSYSIL
jgi:serine/threonine protein kinase